VKAHLACPHNDYFHKKALFNFIKVEAEGKIVRTDFFLIFV
jgi:hypothetical protein